jgi:hypothetical protein
MMYLRSTVLAAAALLSVARSAQAQSPQPRVAVLPISGVNIHPGYLDAARDILKDHLMSTGRFYVIGMPGGPPQQEYSTAQAQELGRSVQAELAVTTHIVHLAGTARVRLTAWRVADGTIAHSDSMTTAGGPDDLDPVLKRLAIGFATGKPAGTTAEIDTVTQKEADPYLKQTATKVFGLRLGAVVPYNRPSGDPAAATGLGLFWMYDARDFMAEVWGDFYRSSAEDITIFDIGIGGYYPFSRRNITPYVGAGAAWSAADIGDGDGASGLRVNGAFGILLGRLWTVQARAEAGYFVNLFGEKNRAGTKTGHSHGPMLTVGLGF